MPCFSAGKDDRVVVSGSGGADGIPAGSDGVHRPLHFDPLHPWHEDEGCRHHPLRNLGCLLRWPGLPLPDEQVDV